MIWPARRARIAGSTAWIIATAPNTLTLELAAQLVERGLLDHALAAVPGVVDEHVDRPALLREPLDRGRDLGAVGHVEHDRARPRRRQLLEVAGRGLGPDGSHHAVARRERRLGKRAAEPRTGACDQQTFRCHAATVASAAISVQ